MAKIKPQHVFMGDGGYLYVIDQHGNMWKRLLPGGTWQSGGELPEDPQQHNSARVFSNKPEGL